MARRYRDYGAELAHPINRNMAGYWQRIDRAARPLVVEGASAVTGSGRFPGAPAARRRCLRGECVWLRPSGKHGRHFGRQLGQHFAVADLLRLEHRLAHPATLAGRPSRRNASNAAVVISPKPNGFEFEPRR
jgi:hypothetical protein